MDGDAESAGVVEVKVDGKSDSCSAPGGKPSTIEKWAHNIEGVERRAVQFTPRGGDPGITKLRKECLTRNAVRVLRSARTISPLAPKAGVRYDGL